MKSQSYTVPLSDLLGHLISHQVPKGAIVHYWYELDTSSSEPEAAKNKRGSIKNSPAFGMWDDNEEMENVAEYVERTRRTRTFD